MEFDRRNRHGSTNGAAHDRSSPPGKSTLTEGMARAGTQSSVPAPNADEAAEKSPRASLPVPVSSGPGPTLQMLFGHRHAAASDPDEVHAAAARGTATAATQLPHLEQIQRSFGRHDVSGVKAHVSADAGASALEMGAQAYATGDHVVLGPGADLHTVTHEAAHVVQQRAGVHLLGGVGEAGDLYEQHADQVADLVVAGKSAQSLLDQKASPGGHAAPAGDAVQHVLQVGSETKRAALTSTTKRTLQRNHGASPEVINVLDGWARDEVDTSKRRFHGWPAAIAAAAKVAAAAQSTASTSATAVGVPARSTSTPAHDATPAPHDATPAPHDDAGTSTDHVDSTANTSVHAGPTTSGPQADDADAASDPLTVLHDPQLPFPGLLFFTHETTPDNVLTQLRGGGMKSRARLVEERTLRPNQDTRKGGGYYVYTRMIGENSKVRLGEGSKGSGGGIMIILSRSLATRNDWFTTGLDLMGRVPPSIMPTTKSEFPSSWTLINAAEAFQPNGKGRMTSTFGMPPEALHRAVDDQLKNPSATNEQGFFGGIPLEYYERIIVKRDRAPTSVKGKEPAAGPSGSSGGSGITSAADLIAEIRKDPALEREILRATGKASLEELIVDKTKGQVVAKLLTGAPPVPGPSTQAGASSSNLPGAPASSQGDFSTPPPDASDAT